MKGKGTLIIGKTFDHISLKFPRVSPGTSQQPEQVVDLVSHIHMLHMLVGGGAIVTRMESNRLMKPSSL